MGVNSRPEAIERRQPLRKPCPSCTRWNGCAASPREPAVPKWEKVPSIVARRERLVHAPRSQCAGVLISSDGPSAPAPESSDVLCAGAWSGDVLVRPAHDQAGSSCASAAPGDRPRRAVRGDEGALANWDMGLQALVRRFPRRPCPNSLVMKAPDNRLRARGETGAEGKTRCGATTVVWRSSVARQPWRATAGVRRQRTIALSAAAPRAAAGTTGALGTLTVRGSSECAAQGRAPGKRVPGAAQP